MADVNITTCSKISTNSLPKDPEVMIIDEGTVHPAREEVTKPETIEILDDTQSHSPENDKIVTDLTRDDISISTNSEVSTREVMIIEDDNSQDTSSQITTDNQIGVAVDNRPEISKTDQALNLQIDEISLIYGDIASDSLNPSAKVPLKVTDTYTPLLKAPTPSNNNTSSNKSMIEINFSDENLMTQYKQKFIQFLETIKEIKCIDEGNKLVCIEKTINDLDLSEWEDESNPEEIDLDDYDDDPNKKKRKRRERVRKKEENLFSIDIEPSNEPGPNLFYKSKFKVIDEPESASEEQTGEEAPQIVCFNCSGEHVLRDCPLPRDGLRIRTARQKIPSVAATRYHAQNTKFPHLKPGIVSERLRKALGIRKHDIPAHVYKMRVLGYPPGWLEEAKVYHSIPNPSDNDSKEFVNFTADSAFTLNPDMIIEYPGFNSKIKYSKDDYIMHGVPPYSSSLSKENMIDFFNRRMTPLNPNVTVKRSPSPTLIDLEAQKKQLLEQLTCNDDSSIQTLDVSIGQDSSLSAENDVAVDLLDKTAEMKEDDNSAAACSTPAAKQSQTIMEASTPQLSCINSSSAGTPIINALSPYSRLPKLDNFQKDISPIINFENLPNSTGKYEQMTTVLTKVRKTLKSRMTNSST